MSDPTCDLGLLKRRNCLKEFFIDSSSGAYSMSRLCLGLMNVVGAIAGLWLAWLGHGQWAAAIIAPVVASDAGVYFGSTRKHYRDCEDER